MYGAMVHPKVYGILWPLIECTCTIMLMCGAMVHSKVYGIFLPLIECTCTKIALLE